MASKIGKLPVTIPAGVTITTNAGEVVVKGPKGELKQSVNDNVKLEIKDGALTVTPANESKAAAAAHGLYRALIQNMVTGVLPSSPSFASFSSAGIATVRS